MSVSCLDSELNHIPCSSCPFSGCTPGQGAVPLTQVPGNHLVSAVTDCVSSCFLTSFADTLCICTGKSRRWKAVMFPSFRGNLE